MLSLLRVLLLLAPTHAHASPQARYTKEMEKYTPPEADSDENLGKRSLPAEDEAARSSSSSSAAAAADVVSAAPEAKRARGDDGIDDGDWFAVPMLLGGGGPALENPQL